MRTLKAVLVILAVSGAVLVTGQAEAATPVDHCPFSATTNVKVTQNLNCAGTNGITVAKGGITVDLNGFTIKGDGTVGTAGVKDASGSNKVTIKNGVVRDFDYGVSIDGAKKVVVSHIVGVDNYDGFDGTGFPFSVTIKSSNFSGNRGAGINTDSSPLTIKSTIASNNANDGMYLSAEGVKVVGGSADGNGYIGIEVGGQNARISRVEIDGNGVAAPDDGLVSEDAGIVVDRVKASGNSFDGIEIYRQPGETAPTGTIKNSIAYANGRIGINADGDNSTIKDSKAGANHGAGIYTSGESERIDGNHADGNGYDGGSDGFGLGIETVNHPTTTPTGHNEASGNDAPQECNPTSLC